MLAEGCSRTVIAEKFGIGMSTVTGIKKSREKILAFHKQDVDLNISFDRKTMRMGGDEKLDEAVYVWFRQKRQEKSPVTGPILCEKALQLSKILSGKNFKKFVASTGWLWRFCKRFGIRSLSL